MSIKPILKLMMNHQLLALTGSNALLKPFYQLNYLVAAKECGLFDCYGTRQKILNSLPKFIAQMTRLGKL